MKVYVAFWSEPGEDDGRVIGVFSNFRAAMEYVDWFGEGSRTGSRGYVSEFPVRDHATDK